ncbi:hypothetical protein E2562_037521, partial [Oryza meyeriana var. granulata]
KMVILCGSNIGITPVHSPVPSRWLSRNDSPRVCYHIPISSSKLRKQSRHQRVISFSKSSSLQDPVTSVKPSRLLETDELCIFRNNVPEEIISSVRLEESDAFYMLELSTSREFSSSLLDKNAAVLICLIDADGDSLLQRIPAIYWNHSAQGRKAEQLLPFQSGSVDVVTFKGSKLQRIKEIWIGLESGSWRINNLSLKVIHGPLNTPPDLEAIPGLKFNGLLYTFDKISILLGEDGASVVEARPVAVTDLSGISLSDLQEGQLSSASTTSSIQETKEDGLKEYADLKQSLLLYDLAIVITDGLPVLSSPSEAGSAQPSVKGFSGIRRPWLILSLLMVAGAVALNPAAAAAAAPSNATAISPGRNSTAPPLPPFGANHTVGEGAGWFFDGEANASAANYSAWAANRTFYLGDYLSFSTNTDNTVVHTTNATVCKLCGGGDGRAAAGCNGGWKPEEAFLTVMLTTEGANYFFSDAGGGQHCRKGMRFEVTVAHGRGLPPVPASYYEPLSTAPAADFSSMVGLAAGVAFAVILVL